MKDSYFYYILISVTVITLSLLTYLILTEKPRIVTVTSSTGKVFNCVEHHGNLSNGITVKSGGEKINIYGSFTVELVTNDVIKTNMEIIIKPISHWVGKETKMPRRSQFKATYQQTKKLLESELEKLRVVANVSLEMFIRQEDLRADGFLRANVKPSKQGVVLVATRIKNTIYHRETGRSENVLQTLTYPCDAFDDWQDNLRGVALSLQALRAVERYGVFRYEDIVQRLALPSAQGKISSVETAAEFVAEHSGLARDEVLRSGAAFLQAYRRAATKLHPDAGGNSDDFLKLQEAKKIIEGQFS